MSNSFHRSGDAFYISGVMGSSLLAMNGNWSKFGHVHQFHCWRRNILTEFPQEIETPPALIASWIRTESPFLRGLDCYV
jgi:hypothetical protein